MHNFQNQTRNGFPQRQHNYTPYAYSSSSGNASTASYPDKADYPEQEDWLRAMTLYILSKSENIMVQRYNMNERAKRLYTAITDASKIPSYAADDDGLSFSGITYEHLNSIANPIDVYIGEIASKGFNVNVYVNNEEAKSRKEQVRAMHLIKRFTAEKFPELMDDEERQQMREKLDIDKAMAGYRDVYELAIDRALTDWMARSNFEDWLNQTALACILTNTAIGCPYIDPQTFEVILDYVDPSTFVFDVDCKDDFFKDKKYYVHFDYLSLNSVLQMYPDLDKEEIVKRGSGTASQAFLGYPIFRHSRDNDFDQVLVVRCYFMYQDEMEREHSEIKGYSLALKKEDGKEPVVSESVDKETTSERYPYENIYYCDLLGGHFVIKGGVMPYQQRSIRMPAKAQLNSQCLCFGYGLDTMTPPMPVRVEALQVYRNALFFKFIQMVARMKGAITEIDVRYMPEFVGTPDGERLKKYLDEIQSNGIILKDSSLIDAATLDGGKVPPAITVTMIGMPAEVSVLLEHINFLNMEIQQIIGFNAARTGGISKYEKVSNTMLNKTQSDYSTAYRGISFDRFIENTLTTVANLLKMSIYLKKKHGSQKQKDSLRISIGDEFSSLVDDDHEFLFQDIGLHFKRRDMSDTEKMNELKMMVQAGLQNGSVDFLAALQLQKYDSPIEAIEAIEKVLREKQIREEQMAMQQQQMQNQQAQQMQQQQLQAQQQQQAQKIDADQITQAANMQGQKDQNKFDLLKESVNRSFQTPKEPIRTAGVQ